MKPRKIIVSLICLATIAFSLVGGSITALASEDDAYTEEETIVITTRAEVREWRYRTYNGVYQKRLWSVTYLKWLTEWTNV